MQKRSYFSSDSGCGKKIATAGVGGGCTIWAEFVQTRVGCSGAMENFWFTANDQFYSRKNLFQPRPNDATLTPVVSCRPPRLQTNNYLFVAELTGLGEEFLAAADELTNEVPGEGARSESLNHKIITGSVKAVSKLTE